MIEAVIFDWAGTAVDYGSMAPIRAMQDAFAQEKLDIKVTLDEIRKPMGMLKIDHIKAVLAMDEVAKRFYARHQRKSEDGDAEIINQAFEASIFKILKDHATPIPGMLDTQKYLRDNNIKIGSTSGYTKKMLAIVASVAAEKGYKPDYKVAADQVKKGRGRPCPDMINENLNYFHLENREAVIKVGDTIVDIQEGKNAKCISVGVILGSSLLGLAEEEVARLATAELSVKMEKVRASMYAEGADYVIDSIGDLPALIQKLNEQCEMNKGIAYASR